ncbi:MAG: alpha/beta fold hydrolase [Actinomycetota bacterium]
MTEPTTTSPADGANRPRTGVAGWLGRPVHLEFRAPFELRALRRSPLWQGEGVPPGRGRGALIVPGFFAAPRGAQALQHVLTRAGWRAEIAAVGRNSGPAYTGIDATTADALRLREATGQPVRIVGHSRGGQYARIIAVRHPELVRQIVVVGTPLLVKYPDFAAVKVPAEVLDRAWRAGAFGEVFPDREQAVDQDRYAPFPSGIDFVSIYSRSDGIVDWRLSIEPAAHTVEISASHRGLLNSVAGVGAVAGALARLDEPEFTDRQATPRP